MKLHFLGGASEVGASCTLIELEGQRILVDAGIRMGAAPGGQLPNLALLDEVGAPEEVLITHAHSDHTGALPVLVPGLPGDVPLRCTAPTQAIAAVLLQDALKIMQQGEREGDLPLYAPEAVELTLARMQAVPHLVDVPICGGALRATWIPAGHILGAASIYIEGRRESLLMGGDISVGQQQSIPGMVVPRCRPDVVVLESTYGNRRHADRAQQETALVRQVAEAVTAGGKVLIPAFAVGRSQEVVLIIVRAMRRGDIPAFPVWVDGMVRAVNAVYASFPDMLSPPLRRRCEKGENPFYTDAVKAVQSPAKREQVLAGPPSCIVASSGMLTGGASAFYATRLAGGPENLIAITGYQDEESPGRALLDLARVQSQSGERMLKLQGQRLSVACRVETYALSAHADGGELASLVRRLAPQAAYLVHGEDEARRALATELDLHLSGGVHLPENGCAYTFEYAHPESRNRRYGGSGTRHGLGRGLSIDASALEQIRAYLVETGNRGLLRVQDVAEIWWGTDQISAAEIEACKICLDGDRQCFMADHRRPYLFRIAETDEVEGSAGRMEMNRARQHIQAAFPPESGLFRCGIHQEEGAFELAFHFPDVVRTRCSDVLQSLEEETGWSILLRHTPHQERLFEEALAAVPQEVEVVKSPALHLEGREVVIGVRVPPAAMEIWEGRAEKAAESFAALTGYALVFSAADASGPPPAAEVAAGRWEINRAYAALRSAFAEKSHAPYKVGQKSDADGPYIEVAFISPAVGRRYEELLRELAAEMGWPMRMRQAVHQQQIAAEAGRITPAPCHLCGEPRLYLAEGRVVVSVDRVPSAEEVPSLVEAFEQRTGFLISWESIG